MPQLDKKSLSERDICTKFITPALVAAGWNIDTQIREEVGFTDGRIYVRGKIHKRGKQKRADHILYYKPNIPIAVIEAKDNNHTVGAGMQQALGYADAKTLDISFVFSSNGDAFLFHDKTVKSGAIEKEIPLNAFPSPEQLWQKYKAYKGITDDIAPIVAQDYFSDGSNRAPRYYQQIAINRTVEAIARNEGNNRHLLVMATGCGKTYAAFQIIYRLWKSGLKKRILFLADRTDLIDQTVRNDFRHFKEAMTVIKHRHIDTAYNIYLALYQGLADIARHSLGKMLDKGKNRGTEKPYLRNLNVRWYEVELSDLETMPFEEHESEKYSVRRGDVLICEGGHGIGRAAVWNSDDTVMFQKALHRVRFFGGFFEPELFVHFLRWSETSGHIAKFYIGAGIPHLTGDSIHDMPVPLPPLAEQAAIVARVATLLGSSRMLALELAASRTPAAHLLQAVLKSVFTPAA